ncbi:MAG: rRNA maturation RNase YbeY [Bacteroidota bacterium]|nr:rRNA maturation RNase YbeY [Bacteroidota bacterium]
MCGAQVSGGRITFHYRPDIGSWRLRPASRYKAWLKMSLAAEGRGEIAHLAYTFVSTSEMQTLHETLLGDPSPTDVLTLDYREASDAPLLAEIFICPAFVKTSARTYRLPYGEELRRVLVHALLHLLGFRDDTPENRLRMRFAEERCLSLWKTLNYFTHETPRV